MKEETAMKKKLNPLLWFLFAVIIPITVFGIIAVIILNVAGYDPVGWAKEKTSDIPILSAVIPDEEEKEISQEASSSQANTEAKNEEIFDLQQSVKELEETNELLEREIIKLENKLQNEGQGEEDPAALQESNASLDDIKKTYEEMKPKQAAPIISELEEETAILILRELSSETTGSILAAMDPKLAAKYTKQLLEEE